MTRSSTSHWNQAKLSLQCLLSCLEDVKHWMDGNFLQLNESKTQISGTLICIKYWQINSLADFSTTAKIKQFLSFWELRVLHTDILQLSVCGSQSVDPVYAHWCYSSPTGLSSLVTSPTQNMSVHFLRPLFHLRFYLCCQIVEVTSSPSITDHQLTLRAPTKLYYFAVLVIHLFIVLII